MPVSFARRANVEVESTVTSTHFHLYENKDGRYRDENETPIIMIAPYNYPKGSGNLWEVEIDVDETDGIILDRSELEALSEYLITVVGVPAWVADQLGQKGDG